MARCRVGLWSGDWLDPSASTFAKGFQEGVEVGSLASSIESPRIAWLRSSRRSHGPEMTSTSLGRSTPALARRRTGWGAPERGEATERRSQVPPASVLGASLSCFNLTTTLTCPRPARGSDTKSPGRSSERGPSSASAFRRSPRRPTNGSARGHLMWNVTSAIPRRATGAALWGAQVQSATCTRSRPPSLAS